MTASSSQNAYPPDNVADGSSQTFWVSNGYQPGDAPTAQKPEWLRFDFPKAVTVAKLHLMPRTPFGPREIEVQVSEDGQKFVTVKAFSVPNEPSTELPLPETTARVFRILVTASYASQNTQITEAWWGDQKPSGRRALLGTPGAICIR